MREANGTKGDVERTLRSARELLGGRLEARAADRMEAAVAAQLEGLGTAVEKAMKLYVDKVGREFDRLAAILTGLDPESVAGGKPPLETLLRAYADGIEARRADLADPALGILADLRAGGHE